jgi:hypothetical protein
MTFGRDQNPKIEGSKGALKHSDIRNSRISEAMKNRWNNPDFQKKHIERLRKYNEKRTKESFAEMGRKSRLYENIVAERIKNSYDILFKPNEICDRIGVRNGKIFFIEIKNKSNKSNAGLTTKQRLFKNITKNKYLIEYF